MTRRIKLEHVDVTGRFTRFLITFTLVRVMNTSVKLPQNRSEQYPAWLEVAQVIVESRH